MVDDDRNDYEDDKGDCELEGGRHPCSDGRPLRI